MMGSDMRTRTWISMAAVTMLAVGLLGPAVGATDHGGTITVERAQLDGDTLTVRGSATFSADEPQDVGGFVTESFAAPELSDTLGMALTGATIETLADSLRFTWVLESLPAEVPPEGIRYTWSFGVDGRQYQLQAKRSNLVSSTTAEDPVGHAQQAGQDFFQLRGACDAQYLGTPISGCYHLAFLDGEFDIENGTVSMDVPFETTDAIGRLVAGDIKPGASLVAVETAAMSIAASAQVFVSNTLSSNYLNGWKTYHVDRVELGVGTADDAPKSWTAAEMARDRTFTGTVSGLTSTDTVYARACAGATCSSPVVVTPTEA